MHTDLPVKLSQTKPSNSGLTTRRASLIVQCVAEETLGTTIEMHNAPLISAGLDSIAVVEFVNSL